MLNPRPISASVAVAAVVVAKGQGRGSFRSSVLLANRALTAEPAAEGDAVVWASAGPLASCESSSSFDFRLASRR